MDVPVSRNNNGNSNSDSGSRPPAPPPTRSKAPYKAEYPRSYFIRGAHAADALLTYGSSLSSSSSVLGLRIKAGRLREYVESPIHKVAVTAAGPETSKYASVRGVIITVGDFKEERVFMELVGKYGGVLSTKEVDEEGKACMELMGKDGAVCSTRDVDVEKRGLSFRTRDSVLCKCFVPTAEGQSAMRRMVAQGPTPPPRMGSQALRLLRHASEGALSSQQLGK